jgi:hypothetical protein
LKVAFRLQYGEEKNHKETGRFDLGLNEEGIIVHIMTGGKINIFDGQS